MGSREGAAAALVALAIVGSIGPAAAEPAVDVVAALPPAPGGALAGAVLVGRAGQLYHPVAAGVWQRRIGGGVATDLAAAVRARPGDDVLAIGADTPLFRFRGGAWRAESVGNRGPAALSATGPVPTLAVGRHVYTLEAGAWVRRVSAAQRVTAAWAASPKALVVATSDGVLSRWEGRRFAPLRSATATEPIVALVGASPAALYGRRSGGTWLRIDRAAVVALSLAAELAGFEEHAAGTGPDGRLWLAGTVPGASGARRALLVRAERDRLLAAGDVPELAAGDRVSVLLGQAATGEVLVATRSGVVRVRDKKGTWSQGSASADLPPVPVRTGAASGAPARTR